MDTFEQEPQTPATERFRSLRPITLAAIAVVAALIAGGTTYAFASGSGGDSPTVDVTTTSEPQVITPETRPVETTAVPVQESTTTTAKPAANAIPEFTVATSKLNRIVLIDTATGKTTKVLKSWAQPDEGQVCNGPGDVALSPDRKTVYFGVSVPLPDAECGNEIHAMTIDGKDLGVITKSGNSPTVSRDGTKLAFSRIDLTPSGSFRMEIIVMNLADRSEKVIKAFEENVYSGMKATWSPDGKTLVYQATICGCGDFPYLDLVSLDVQTGQERVIYAQYTGAQPVTKYMSDANFLADGSLAVLEQGGMDLGDAPVDKSGRIVVIDAQNGGVKRTIANLNTGAYYGTLDADSSGKHFTFTSDEALMKVTDGENAKGYASGVWSAGW